MSEGVSIASIGILGTLLVAVLGYIVALLVRLNRRIRALERRDAGRDEVIDVDAVAGA